MIIINIKKYLLLGIQAVYITIMIEIKEKTFNSKIINS